MNVAVVSPLPPAPTGVADYSVTLARELSCTMRVDLAEALDESEAASYDACLYHLGNNTLHAPIYDLALKHPGAVVLHDAVLHHFFLGRLDRDEYVEEFVYNYGEWMRPFAEDLWLRRAVSGSDANYFRYPMLRRIVENSRVVIVHNPAAGRLARDAVGKGRNTPIVEIPHFAEEAGLPDVPARSAIRERFGIPPDAVVIGTFGYQRPTKRLRSLVQALQAVDVPYRLLLIGDFVSESYRQAIEPLFAELPVIQKPYVPETEFWELAAITDVGVSLRYPSAGEASAIVGKLAVAGTPVLVTAGEENAAYPDDVFWKVEPGEAEVEMLTEMLLVLMRDKELRTLLGNRARDHLLSCHALPRIAEAYCGVLSEAAAPARWVSDNRRTAFLCHRAGPATPSERQPSQ